MGWIVLVLLWLQGIFKYLFKTLFMFVYLLTIHTLYFLVVNGGRVDIGINENIITALQNAAAGDEVYIENTGATRSIVFLALRL